MWVNYFGLWMLFLFFLGLSIFIYYYSRWQIKGPLFKMKWRKFKIWALRSDKGKVKVKKGNAIIDQRVLEEIERTKTAAEGAQDFLVAQNLETKLEKEKEKALKEYDEKSSKSKNVFKSKKKDETKEEDVSGVSILDELGSGDSAQDLLHSEEQKKIDIQEESTKGDSIFDIIGENDIDSDKGDN